MEHDFEKMFQNSYYHMLERMKKDFIATQIRANELHESSKQKQSIVKEEQDKLLKSKE